MKIKTIHHMNFLKIVFCIIFIFQVVFDSNSQVPNLTWVKSTNTNDFSIANSIEVDNQGNIFSVGQFTATTDFDFGIGTFNLTPNGAEDVFVQKMDSDGNLLWAFKIGGIGSSLGYDDDNIADIEIDNFGNIIVIGQFGGNCDFDPSSNDFFISSVGNSDVFIVKYSTNGDFIWAKSIGGANIDSGTSINCDINDNIIATGQYCGTVDFDPSTNSYAISSNGNSDIFTLKLNSNGDFVWASGTGGFSSDLAYTTIDSNNDILQTGVFVGNVDFDPTNSIYNLSFNNTYYSIFVRKLDLNGDFLWTKGISCSVGSCQATCITTDSDNNIIITGFFQGTCDFDPSLNNYLLTSNGGIDIFILKINSSGDFIWAKSFGGSSTEYGVSIINDTSNNIYTNGIIESQINTVDFDPSNNSYYLNETAGSFLLKLDPDGNFNWVCMPQSSQNLYNVSFCQTNPNSGTGVNGGYSIAEKNNQFYLCGAYMNTVDFDPSTATYNLTSTVPNVNKYFIQKLNFCNQVNTNISESICQSYTWPINNVTYTSSGVYSDTLINMFGCDSIITLNLTIFPTQTNTVSISNCGPYISPMGNSYSTSGTYQEIYTAQSGCDSTVNILLTINNSATVNQSITACSSFTSPTGNNYTQSGQYFDTLTAVLGCDSIIVTQLTIFNPTTSTISPTICNTYTAPDNAVYTSSGQYTAIIPNAAGCDSTITINLTLNNSNNGTYTKFACDTFTWIDGITYTESNNTATFTLQNVSGCDSVVTLNLTINKLQTLNAGSDQTVCKGENVTLTASGAQTYSWNNGVLDGVAFSPPLGTTTYTVTGTDGNGCTDTDDIVVTSEYCFEIPGALSPNSDNNNDTWEITGLQNYPNAIISVFDRWGQKVYEGTSTSAPWNGKYQDKDLPTADYYYIIELGNGDKYNGVVTLKR